MTNSTLNRLVILTGPSCVGKSPLEKALGKFYPELRKSIRKMILYNSRSPRPGEVNGIDYHFRSREHIEALQEQEKYLVMDVRGDLQAIDIEEMIEILTETNVFFEGNPFVAGRLLTNPNISRINQLSIYLSPISKEEIVFLRNPELHVSLPDFITDIMRRKLLSRTQKQKGELSLRDLENIERRASSAYKELKQAWRFDYVIPNHDGEDSDNWDAFYFPLGDARRTLITFVELMEGKIPPRIEKWEEDLLP
jgi:guanylate kinase